LALEATVLIRGPAGGRRIPIDEFFVGPRKTLLGEGELVTGIELRKPPDGTASSYVKLSRRRAGDLAIVGVAALAMPHNGGYRWRIALSAIAPTPIRTPDAEAILAEGHDDASLEAAARRAFVACSPIDDIRSGLEYRCAMIVNITRRALRNVVARL
jgi:carbon-monoxide dehydrogenase medium subunit